MLLAGLEIVRRLDIGKRVVYCQKKSMEDLMALEDKDLLELVRIQNPNQDTSYILKEFVKAKKELAMLERGENVIDVDLIHQFQEESKIEQGALSAKGTHEEQSSSKKREKRWAKKDLKYLADDPNKAITEETITCCICGEKKSVLTKKHLENHGISVLDYKRICGYQADARLMSHKRSRETSENVKKAQAAPRKKKGSESK